MWSYSKARVLLISFSFVCVLAGPVASAAPAAGVRIDRSFGEHGLVAPMFGPTYDQSSFSSIAPQADGSILAGRREGEEESERFSRFDGSGRPLSGPVPEAGTPKPEARQPDGKVVKLATGESLERVDADGSQDPSFGTQAFGSGKRSDDVDFAIEAIVVQPSGDILVAGTKSHSIMSGAPPEPEQVPEQLCVARFEPSGHLDPSFGQGGIVHLHTDLGFAGERLVGLASRPGGGAVVIDADNVGPLGSLTYSAPGSYLVGLTAAGGLDPAYGTGGEVRLAAAVTAFEPLPEGGLVLAGDEWGTPVAGTQIHQSDFFLARYGDDGRPDPAFAGGAPAATADFGGIDLLGALLVEADGSILVGGSSTAATAGCIEVWHACTETPVLARFSAAGTPDPAFGTDGRLTLAQLAEPYSGIEGRGVQALAARPGGGVLIGGGSGPLAFLGALTPSGALDPAFGGGGIATFTEPHPSHAGSHAVAVDPKGRIVIGGGTDAGLSLPGPAGAVFRLRPGGELDRSFGEGGYARVTGEANEVALSGSSVYVLSFHEPLLSRLTPAGRLDPAFGQEGTERADLGSAVVGSLAAAHGGGVFLGGTTVGGNQRVVVGRFSSDGAPDRAFGRAGIAILAFGFRHRCGAEAIAVQPDGRVLVAGYVEAKSRGGTEKRLAVMRLRANGTVDRSFGHGGIVSLGRGTEAIATALTVAPDGEILVGGKSRTGKRVRELFLRLTSAGRFVKGFAAGGISSTPALREANGAHARNSTPSQILVRPGGYLVVRTGSVQPLVAYTRRGRLDARFAAGVVAAGSRDFGLPAVALQGRRLVLVRDRRQAETFQVQRLLLPQGIL
jgi:uncharacterized delta-60 repeat protein